MQLLYNKYIFKCDFLYRNKFLKNFERSSDVKIIFNVNTFVNESDQLSLNSDFDIHVKVFILLYLKTGYTPYVSLLAAKEGFLLKLTFSKLDSFLYTFFPPLYLHFLVFFLKNNKKDFYISFPLENFYFLKYCLKDFFNILSLKRAAFSLRIAL